ncbi:MAG: hypothetical protein ILO42_04705 [Clostridia bacterium]|nr:hypothetical protein [Clostridia bacterium]
MNQKKIRAVIGICLLGAVLISVSLFRIPSSAAGATISEKEAKELILKAHDFYLRYHDGIYDTVRHDPVTTTVGAVSKEAREIYTEDIADGMWMYQCSEWRETIDAFDPDKPYKELEDNCQFFSKDGKNYILYNRGLTYTDNGDGTVTFISYFPQSARLFYLVREYSEEAFRLNGERTKRLVTPDGIPYTDFPAIYPESAEDIWLNALSGTGSAAAGKVMVYLSAFDAIGEVTLMDVEFRLTGSGWRISGGALTKAFSNWTDDEMRKYIDYDVKNLYPRKVTLSPGVTICYFAVNLEDPDAYYRYEKNGEPYSPYYDTSYSLKTSFSDWKLISFDENECVFTMVSSADGKRYDAVFTYFPEYVHRWYSAYSSGGLITLGELGELTGAWRLTGGGIYELALGKTDVAPVTGDRITVIAFSAVLAAGSLAAALCAAARRKKAPVF